MATTTPNFGWSVPTSTDLVKDGATAIETLGDSIDASMADLKGGTTGQVLAKNSNTDMDFVWSTTTAGMTNPLTTTGDTIYSSSGSTPARLGIGSTGQVLTVNSGIPSWSTPASGAITTWTLLNTGGTALTGAATVTITGISNQKQLYVLIDGASSTSASSFIRVRPNNDTATNYIYGGHYGAYESTYNRANYGPLSTTGGNGIIVGYMGSSVSSTVSGAAVIESADSTGWKRFFAFGDADTDGHGAYDLLGLWKGSAAITSISIAAGAGNLDSGTVYVYGGS